MSQRPSSSRLAGLGFEFAAGVGGLAFFGYWIGRYYGNGALGLLIGAAVGIVGGMYNLIRATRVVSQKGAAEAQNSERSKDSS
jgi:F0F1-type ATP synthase assembly protein I